VRGGAQNAAAHAHSPARPRRLRRGPLRRRRGRGRLGAGTAADVPGSLYAGSARAWPFGVLAGGRRLRAAVALPGLAANRSFARRGPRTPPPRKRWWAATAPSLRACAGPSSSVTASTSTARGGVTPTSRTGFENVSGGRPRGAAWRGRGGRGARLRGPVVPAGPLHFGGVLAPSCVPHAGRELHSNCIIIIESVCWGGSGFFSLKFSP
jgi:hypothetical protein